MAVLTITEFEHFTSGNVGSIPFMGNAVEQSVEIGPVSNKSKPFGAKSHFILISPTSSCFIALGPADSVEAKQGFHFIKDGESRTYSIPPGTAIAVIEEEDV